MGWESACRECGGDSLADVADGRGVVAADLNTQTGAALAAGRQRDSLRYFIARRSGGHRAENRQLRERQDFGVRQIDGASRNVRAMPQQAVDRRPSGRGDAVSAQIVHPLRLDEALGEIDDQVAERRPHRPWLTVKVRVNELAA